MDLEAYDQRRSAMLKLLEVGAGRAPFAEWAKHAEAIAPRKQEKLELFLTVLYVLLEDLLALTLQAGDIRNADIRKELEKLAQGLPFHWIRLALKKTDELSELVGATSRRPSRWMHWRLNCGASRHNVSRPAPCDTVVVMVQ